MRTGLAEVAGSTARRMGRVPKKRGKVMMCRWMIKDGTNVRDVAGYMV